ncbi:sigma-70 family RNA polymerase sigma factor [Nocardioides agariphilus]|jgi:RNA polymerase sigma-B factor|uniref:Sigma-70 family RNA polymerase sigma factor n=2 Tax=Nocardioides agariphilus TaxID=433664 RepID=A0A930VRY5_9ACTN|nr:sigma-70 family RNA polymerase sigma factor [Nocardioides agariphilus]
MTSTTLERDRPRHLDPPRHSNEAERRAERAASTTELMARAATCPQPERARLLGVVVELNMCVADAIASRYRGRGVADEDLRQVAYLALTKAARKFDPDAGHDFLSYAVPTIRGEVCRYFRDCGWMVRPPRKVQELQSRIFAAQTELSLTLGRSPSPTEVAALLSEPLGDVEEALAAEGCFTPTSLDRPLTSDSDMTIGDLLRGVDGSRSAAEARVVLAPLVRKLSDRDRLVLQMRFYDDRTQQEIAEQIGVTQTQVSRLLARIFGELRTGLEGAQAAS